MTEHTFPVTEVSDKVELSVEESNRRDRQTDGETKRGEKLSYNISLESHRTLNLMPCPEDSFMYICRIVVVRL